MKSTLGIAIVVCALGFVLGTLESLWGTTPAVAGGPSPRAEVQTPPSAPSAEGVAPSSGRRLPDSTLAGRSAGEAFSEYLELVHEGRCAAETIAYLEEWLRANPEATVELVHLAHARVLRNERSGWSGVMAALRRAKTSQASASLRWLSMAPTSTMRGV